MRARMKGEPRQELLLEVVVGPPFVHGRQHVLCEPSLGGPNRFDQRQPGFGVLFTGLGVEDHAAIAREDFERVAQSPLRRLEQVPRHGLIMAAARGSTGGASGAGRSSLR